MVTTNLAKLEKNHLSLNLQTGSQYMMIGEGRKTVANDAAWVWG